MKKMELYYNDELLLILHTMGIQVSLGKIDWHSARHQIEFNFNHVLLKELETQENFWTTGQKDFSKNGQKSYSDEIRVRNTAIGYCG